MIERQRVALSKKYFSKVLCFFQSWQVLGSRGGEEKCQAEEKWDNWETLSSGESPPWTDLRKDERHRFKWERAKTQKKKACGNIGTLAVPIWKVELYKYILRKSEEKAEEKWDNWETLSTFSPLWTDFRKDTKKNCDLGNKWKWLKKTKRLNVKFTKEVEFWKVVKIRDGARKTLLPAGGVTN